MNILERFHLALSYLEKSQHELRKWERVRESRMVDLSQFDLVRDRYVRHVKQAEELVETIRTSQKESLPILDEEIYDLKRAQKKLNEAITDGNVKPKLANKQNRAIALDLERLEETRDWADLIARAESTKVFAGPIDVPFTEYTKLLDLDEPDDLNKPEASGIRVNPRNVLIIVVIGLAFWAAWSYYQTLGHIDVDYSVEDNKQILRAVCENTGNRTVRIVVPWQNGVPEDGSVSQLQGRTFGILVSVQEKGNDIYQIVPETPEMWDVNGSEHTSGGLVTLSPGEKIAIELNTLELRKSGIAVDKIRVEFTRFGGRVVGRYQTKLP